MKRTAVFFLCLLFACTALSRAEEASRRTPSISTRQLLDKIAASRGKVVVINFFASFCPPCRLEIPGLIAMRSELPAADLEIIGVSLDEDMGDMESFVADCRFNFPVYHGGSELAFAYHVTAIPHNVVYDRKGRIVFNQAGYVPDARFRALLARFMQEQPAAEEAVSAARKK
jgi:thiol-disulfide isomerase/thioredoxin